MSRRLKVLLCAALLLLSASGCSAQQQSSTQATEEPVPYQVGQWQPSDQRVLNQWVADLVRETNAEAQPLVPVVQEFKDLIESDPELLMLFTQMFDQVPSTPKYRKDPTGQPQIRDYRVMLQLINQIITKAPEFNKTGLVGFPINAIIDWPMGTQAGTTVFLDPRVNSQIKKILGQWAEFLQSSESRAVLNDDPKTGWFGRDAKAAMPTFVEDFQCDPKQPYYGFTSWDDFFTRQFREGRRPVASPMDDAVVANSCESAPYRLATDVKGSDTFWIKSQPYSLYHLLAGDPLVG
jgi:phosphatidylserine decarboxylase